jgi:hypothetical protein
MLVVDQPRDIPPRPDARGKTSAKSSNDKPLSRSTGILAGRPDIRTETHRCLQRKESRERASTGM